MFKNCVVLAPMVRVNNLAMRLLCLKYGADLVWSQEIVDHQIIKCKRVINEKHKTIEYVNASGEVIFSTCDEEKGKILFQLGTKSAKRAVRILELLENDISGLDINMGCPKHFSISGGMGAALLSNKRKAMKILDALKKKSKIPITCKIRLLPDIESTFDFMDSIIETGVDAITVHGRTRFQTSSQLCNIDDLRKITERYKNIVPIIINGGSLDIATNSDISAFLHKSNGESIMIARAAQMNPSIFMKDGPIDVQIVLKEYIELCLKWNVDYVHCKYLVGIMASKSSKGEDIMNNILKAKDYMELLFAANISCDIPEDVLTNRNRAINCFNYPDSVVKCLEPQEIKEMSKKCGASKCKLNEYKKKLQLKAFFETVEHAKYFQSCLDVNGQKYIASNLFKNKRNAEEAAAYVYLFYSSLNFTK